MSSNQEDVTREVLDAVHTFLGGPQLVGDEWCFEFGEHLGSTLGATGVLCTVARLRRAR